MPGVDKALNRATVALLLVGAGAAVHAALGFPGPADLPGWFYRPSRPGLRFGGLGLTCLVLALGSAVAAHRLTPRALWRPLLAVFAASLLAQVGMMALSAGGLETFWMRLSGGHGEFLRVAHGQTDLIDTLRGYEGLVAADRLGHFPPSKPPGALAFYALMDRLGELLRGPLAPLIMRAELAGVSTHAPGAAVALGLLPLTTALVAPLASVLTTAIAGRSQGVVAGILIGFTPTTLLITHHLDGALYPLFAVGTAACWVAAVRSERPAGQMGFAFCGGALLMVGLYTTFSLLPAGLLAAALAAGAWLSPGEDRGDGATAMFVLGGAVVGFALVLALLVLGLGFEPVARFHGAMAHHEQWKAAVPTMLWRFVAPVEFLLWVGWPMVLVWLVGAGPLWRHEHQQRWVGRVVLIVLLLSSALAGTNEVARLWAFLMPFIAVSVALAFQWRRRALAALVLAQLATSLGLAAAGPW